MFTTDDENKSAIPVVIPESKVFSSLIMIVFCYWFSYGLS